MKILGEKGVIVLVVFIIYYLSGLSAFGTEFKGKTPGNYWQQKAENAYLASNFEKALNFSQKAKEWFDSTGNKKEYLKTSCKKFKYYFANDNKMNIALSDSIERLIKLAKDYKNKIFYAKALKYKSYFYN